jgi:hypothetical protein
VTAINGVIGKGISRGIAGILRRPSISRNP